MIKVGITGGIGSGKTTVCKIFETLNIPVYYADTRAKKLMTSDRKLKVSLIKLLGKEAYYKNGRLNRTYVAGKVFKDKKILSALNGLVHPAVLEDTIDWFNQQNAPYGLKEAALLFESKGYLLMDKVITVVADEEERINRVMQRDDSKRTDVIARINNQWKDKDRINKSDFVINNNRRELLIPQIMKIHQELLQLSK